MTLTDFLLARLTEDEGDAPGYPSPARWMAECEAKRQIVNMEESYEDAYVTAVRALATVYADHPDYRPEWRP